MPFVTSEWTWVRTLQVRPSLDTDWDIRRVKKKKKKVSVYEERSCQPSDNSQTAPSGEIWKRKQTSKRW